MIHWRNLKYIYDNTINLYIATSLLETCTLVGLTHLEVTFERLDHLQIRFPKHKELKELLSSIENASFLQHVIFRATAMSLVDLDQLRNSLSRLKMLELDRIYLENAEGQRPYTANTASQIESFTLKCFVSDEHGLRFNEDVATNFNHLLCDWFSYVGENYPNIKIFHIHYPGKFKPLLIDITIKTHMVNMISHLHCTTTYH